MTWPWTLTDSGRPLGLLAIGSVLAATAAANNLGPGLAGCTWKTLTGWPCSGCGATRAMNHLLDGRILPAFEMNPLATSVALSLAAWGLADALALMGGRRLSFRPDRTWIRTGAGIFVLINGLNWTYLVVAGR